VGAWNGTLHSFTSNLREIRTVEETLKREEVVFNKLRGRTVFYFTDNEVTSNVCKKGSSNTLSLHLLVQQLKALEITLGCRLEVILVPGTTMNTQVTYGLSIGIWDSGLNTDFNSFAVEDLLPALPSLSLTKGALIHIGICEDYATLWNVETYTSSWEPHNLMHKNTDGMGRIPMGQFTPVFSTQCHADWSVYGYYRAIDQVGSANSRADSDVTHAYL
jgi:hypothetical protein